MADIGAVLRSPLLTEILEVVLSSTDEWTADELAGETGAPYPTVTKELRRLERAGFVDVRVAGRTKFFAAAIDDAVASALAVALTASLDERDGGGMSKKKDKKKDKGKKKKK